MRRVEWDLMRALQRSVDYSDKANARLDRPERYRRESRRRWKKLLQLTVRVERAQLAGTLHSCPVKVSWIPAYVGIH